MSDDPQLEVSRPSQDRYVATLIWPSDRWAARTPGYQAYGPTENDALREMIKLLVAELSLDEKP